MMRHTMLVIAMMFYMLILFSGIKCAMSRWESQVRPMIPNAIAAVRGSN